MKVDGTLNNKLNEALVVQGIIFIAVNHIAVNKFDELGQFCLAQNTMADVVIPQKFNYISCLYLFFI